MYDVAEHLASLNELQLRAIRRTLYSRLQRMVRYEDPLETPSTNGPMKDAYRQATREFERRSIRAWPSQNQAKAAGCTCEWWGGGAIIAFDAGCPILMEHRRS